MRAKHCRRDLTTVIVHYGSKKNIERRVVISAAQFPSNAEESPPPQQIKDLIRDCEANGLDLVILVISCDTNAHHTVWGSSDCNNREKALLEFLGTTNLRILNVGCKPTF